MKHRPRGYKSSGCFRGAQIEQCIVDNSSRELMEIDLTAFMFGHDKCILVIVDVNITEY